MLGGSGGIPLAAALRVSQAAQLRASLPALIFLKDKPAKYQSVRRSGVKIDEIVLHATESGGDQTASLNYLSHADDRQVSIHYWIGRDYGLIYSMVPEDRRAHHAETHNDRAIGIEMYQLDGFKGDYTDWQYDAVSQLVYDIRWRWNIAKDMVVPHSKLTSQRGDPKNFDWNRFNLLTAMLSLKALVTLGPNFTLS
jgi:N-acetyl-anhydromuramyl-L-alanine amidase AmpD